MVDLITGPIDPAQDVAAQGASVAQPSSMFSDIDLFDTTKQVGRSMDYAQRTYGVTDPESGRILVEPDPSVPPDQLKHLEVPDSPGVSGLHFTQPLPLAVAQEMHDAKQEEIQRASIAGNQPGGAVSFVARSAVGIAAGMLDPINIAASMMPVIGEARLGAALARGLGEETAGRLATAAVIGGARGAAGQAPLVGLRLGLSQQEQADYGASNAMADMVMGTLLGGGLHTIIEGGQDWLGRRFRGSPEASIVDANPAAREGAARAAVAALADDRPVDVASYIRLSNEAEVRRAQVASLAREVDALRSEAEAVPNATESVASPDSLIHPPVPDAATQARIDAVLDELTGPEPLTGERAAELSAEHRMLTEGQRAGTDLEQARSDAQRQGLLIAAERTEARMRDLQQQIAQSETVRRAAGSPEAEALATSRQADASLAVKMPERPELPPEPDAETMAAHLEAAKALIEPPKEPAPGESTAAPIRGMLTASERAELEAMDAAQSNAEGEAKAFENYGMCLGQGLLNG